MILKIMQLKFCNITWLVSTAPRKQIKADWPHSIIKTLAWVLHITYLIVHPDTYCSSYFWGKDNSSNNNTQNHEQINNFQREYEWVCQQKVLRSQNFRQENILYKPLHQQPERKQLKKKFPNLRYLEQLVFGNSISFHPRPQFCKQ